MGINPQHSCSWADALPTTCTRTQGIKPPSHNVDPETQSVCSENKVCCKWRGHENWIGSSTWSQAYKALNSTVPYMYIVVHVYQCILHVGVLNSKATVGGEQTTSNRAQDCIKSDWQRCQHAMVLQYTLSLQEQFARVLQYAPRHMLAVLAKRPTLMSMSSIKHNSSHVWLMLRGI